MLDDVIHQSGDFRIGLGGFETTHRNLQGRIDSGGDASEEDKKNNGINGGGRMGHFFMIPFFCFFLSIRNMVHSHILGILQGLKNIYDK